MNFFLKKNTLGPVMAVFLAAALAHADKAWDQYLGLSKDQRVQYKNAEQSRKSIIDPARQDKESATQNLVSQVLANAGDAAVGPILGQITGDTKTIDGAEEMFWRSVSGFLASPQVAKIFLKWHQPKYPAASPAPPAPKPAGARLPKLDWNSYFGFNKDLQDQLKSADQAKNAEMKSDRNNQEAYLEQLDQQVQGNAGDSAIQITLTSLFSALESEHHAEQNYWGTTLPGFLTPTQVAKLYLHRHSGKIPFNPPGLSSR